MLCCAVMQGVGDGAPQLPSRGPAGTFAWLLVQLPAVFTGGAVVAQHAGQGSSGLTSTGLADSAAFECSYLAVLSDVERLEFEPLSSGYRVFLVYALCWADATHAAPTCEGLSLGPAMTLLRPIVTTGWDLLPNELLAVPLQQVYKTGTVKCITDLQSGDGVLAGALRALSDSLPPEQQLHLSVVTFKYSKMYEMYREDGYDMYAPTTKHGWCSQMWQPLADTGADVSSATVPAHVHAMELLVPEHPNTEIAFDEYKLEELEEDTDDLRVVLEPHGWDNDDLRMPDVLQLTPTRAGFWGKAMKKENRARDDSYLKYTYWKSCLVLWRACNEDDVVMAKASRLGSAQYLRDMIASRGGDTQDAEVVRLWRALLNSWKASAAARRVSTADTADAVQTMLLCCGEDVGRQVEMLAFMQAHGKQFVLRYTIVCALITVLEAAKWNPALVNAVCEYAAAANGVSDGLDGTWVPAGEHGGKPIQRLQLHYGNLHRYGQLTRAALTASVPTPVMLSFIRLLGADTPFLTKPDKYARRRDQAMYGGALVVLDVTAAYPWTEIGTAVISSLTTMHSLSGAEVIRAFAAQSPPQCPAGILCYAAWLGAHYFPRADQPAAASAHQEDEITPQSILADLVKFVTPLVPGSTSAVAGSSKKRKADGASAAPAAAAAVPPPDYGDVVARVLDEVGDGLFRLCGSARLQELVAALTELKGTVAAEMRAVVLPPLCASILRAVNAVLARGVPPFTWEQPRAVSKFTGVEAFLRGPEESTTLLIEPGAAYQIEYVAKELRQLSATPAVSGLSAEFTAVEVAGGSARSKKYGLAVQKTRAYYNEVVVAEYTALTNVKATLERLL